MRYCANVLIVLLILSFALSGTQQASAAMIEGSRISAGNWKGGAWTNDETGRFSHCLAAADYENAETLSFSRTRNGDLVIGLSGSALQAQPGENIPVSLFVDGRKVADADMVGYPDRFSAITLEPLKSVMGPLIGGNRLTVKSGESETSYRLTGSRRALDLLDRCLQTYANAATQPRLAPQTVPEPAKPFGDGIDPGLLFEVATTAITSLGLRDVRFLSQKQVADRGLGGAVMWQASELDIEGAVLSLRVGDTVDLRTSDNNEAQVLAARCEGDWTLRAVNVPDTGLPTRHITVICGSATHAYESHLVKSFTPPFVVVSILYFPPSGDQNVMSARTELMHSIAKRLGTAVRRE